MGKVDRFSRRPDWKVETDNSNQMLIKKARSKDEEVVRVVERDEEGRSKSIIRRWIADRRRFGVEERKDLYAKEQRVQWK